VETIPDSWHTPRRRLEDLDDFISVLRALEKEADLPGRVALVLGWVSTALALEGVAFVNQRHAEGAPEVLAALGTLANLSTAGPLALGAASRGPAVAFPPSPREADGGAAGLETYWHPVLRDDGDEGDAIILQGRDASRAASLHERELYLAGSVLRDMLEKARLRGQLEREKSFISLLVDRKITEGQDAVNPGFDLVTEGLNLPLYMSDTAGGLMYASPAFLALVGYATVEHVRAEPGFFLDPQARSKEMALLRARGKVSGFSLTVKTGNGRRLEIRDSAVTVGVFAFGVFFDVTDFLAANKELKDSLEIQELLNDRIISASQTLERTQTASIRALARLAEFRNQQTGFHLQRMREYSRILAQQVFERQPYPFRLTATYTNDISLSSMLHDIGKVSVPDSILLKPGELSPEEWEVMKRHTVAGWEILHQADKELGEQSFLTLASIIALSHHERYDGTGYPSGLRGERIPLSARISALADVYDALTTRRPYKEAWSHERAVEEIRGLSGKHFDPILVDMFLRMSQKFDEVRKVFPE
jgi:HD-GYP domain-containing protein (c-di-GMP phosphodiesterase class II)